MNDVPDINTLKYPIGQFVKPTTISQSQLDAWIDDIAAFPARLKAQALPLSVEQLSWKYRPQGWSIRQVIHHCADSHINSLVRFKLALTEDSPTIKPYFEDRWAELPDTYATDIGASLKILEGLHARWTALLKSLSPADWERDFVHPEQGKKLTLAENAGIYAWHCNHHLAHIAQALKWQGKFHE